MLGSFLRVTDAVLQGKPRAASQSSVTHTSAASRTLMATLDSTTFEITALLGFAPMRGHEWFVLPVRARILHKLCLGWWTTVDRGCTCTGYKNKSDATVLRLCSICRRIHPCCRACLALETRAESDGRIKQPTQNSIRCSSHAVEPNRVFRIQSHILPPNQRKLLWRAMAFVQISCRGS